MKYLLDTNTCIQHLNQRSASIIRRLADLSASDIAVCSVVKTELFFGAAKSQTREQTLAKQIRFLDQFVSLPFDDRAAEIAGPIRAQLQKRGTPIGPLDLLIASIALANDLILVTHNTVEFSRVDGLRIEDWEV